MILMISSFAALTSSLINFESSSFRGPKFVLVAVLLLSLQLLAGTEGPLWNGGCCLDGVTGGVRIPEGGAVTTLDLYFGIEGLLSRLMAEASESFLRARSFLLRS